MNEVKLAAARVVLSNFKPMTKINPKAFFVTNEDILKVVHNANLDLNAYWLSKILKALAFPVTFKKVNGKTTRGYFVVNVPNPDFISIDNRLDMIGHTIIGLKSINNNYNNSPQQDALPGLDIPQVQRPKVPFFETEKEILAHIAMHWVWYKRFMPPVIVACHLSDPQFQIMTPQKKHMLIENAGFVKKFVCDPALQIDKTHLTAQKKSKKSFRDSLEAVTKLRG